MQRQLTPRPDSQQGVVLIEALVAILIFSIGILGIVGMQANMLKNTGDSRFRTDAAYIAQKKIGQMWADPANILTYVTTESISELPNGETSVLQPSPGEFLITVTWQQPGESQHSYSTLARINGN